MSLQGDGKAAMAAILEKSALFPRIKPADWSSAATKLAKKQVVAAGLTTNDLDAIQKAIGGTIFDKTLNDLTAFQAKLLAKRIDPDVTQEEIASKSMALIVIRDRLNALSAPAEESTDAEDRPAGEDAPKPKANPYIGRKAFRVR